VSAAVLVATPDPEPRRSLPAMSPVSREALAVLARSSGLAPVPGRPVVFAPTVCTRCGRIDHEVEGCPLPAIPGRAQSGSGAGLNGLLAGER